MYVTPVHLSPLYTLPDADVYTVLHLLLQYIATQVVAFYSPFCARSLSLLATIIIHSYNFCAHRHPFLLSCFSSALFRASQWLYMYIYPREYKTTMQPDKGKGPNCDGHALHVSISVDKEALARHLVIVEHPLSSTNSKSIAYHLFSLASFVPSLFLCLSSLCSSLFNLAPYLC